MIVILTRIHPPRDQVPGQILINEAFVRETCLQAILNKAREYYEAIRMRLSHGVR
jgi:hypothetical protein